MRVGLYFNMIRFLKEERDHKERRQPCNNWGRDGNDASTSQGAARIHGKHQSWKRRGRLFLYRLQSSMSRQRLPFGLLASRVVRQILFLKPPSLWFATTAPGTLIQAPQAWILISRVLCIHQTSLKMSHDHFWKSNLMYSSGCCSNCYI